MNITILGTGYIGLTTGTCLAKLGHKVTCFDVDKEKINLLQKGVCPIYEPGLDELIKKNVKAKRLRFSLNIETVGANGCSPLQNPDMIFIAVGTPSAENGEVDLKYVKKAAEDIGKNLKYEAIIINKSTVPIGTGNLLKKIIKKYYQGKFEVISNPEFLREGTAINDFFNPDRMVIGIDGENNKVVSKIKKLYKNFKCPILITDLESAEMIKYASNAYLATQISFINNIADLCEKTGANVTEVAKGMKMDKRIGEKAFLRAGIGYGGSCFPKDVKALIQVCRKNKVPFKILEEVENTNQKRIELFLDKLKKCLPVLNGKTVGIWGLSFKPNTDDTREAPAKKIIKKLNKLGVKMKVYDPKAMSNFKKRIDFKLGYCKNLYDAVKGVDALLVLTEWADFKKIDFEKVKKMMNKPLIIDGRNIYQKSEMEKLGFRHEGIGIKEHATHPSPVLHYVKQGYGGQAGAHTTCAR